METKEHQQSYMLRQHGPWFSGLLCYGGSPVPSVETSSGLPRSDGLPWSNVKDAKLSISKGLKGPGYSESRVNQAPNRHPLVPTPEFGVRPKKKEH